jgi:hypothetical protein
MRLPTPLHPRGCIERRERDRARSSWPDELAAAFRVIVSK